MRWVLLLLTGLYAVGVTGIAGAADVDAASKTEQPSEQAQADQPPPRILPKDRVIPKAEATDADCLDCHGVKGFSVPTGKHGETKRRHLDLNDEAFRDSVHGKLPCMQCHNDIDEVPHRKGKLGTVDCVSCHLSLGEGGSPERRSWLAFDELDIVIQTKRYTHSLHANKDYRRRA